MNRIVLKYNCKE